MRSLTGAQRYHQAVQKVWLQGQREMRQFMADELPLLPACGQNRERDELIKEFDRLIALIPTEPQS